MFQTGFLLFDAAATGVPVLADLACLLGPDLAWRSANFASGREIHKHYKRLRKGASSRIRPFSSTELLLVMRLFFMFNPYPCSFPQSLEIPQPQVPRALIWQPWRSLRAVNH